MQCTRNLAYCERSTGLRVGAPTAAAARVHTGSRVPRLHIPRAAEVQEASTTTTTTTTSPAPPPAADTSTDISACPVLAALSPPPVAGIPWWRRLDQLFQPEEYQRDALAGGQITTIPAALGFPKQVMVGNGDDIKRVLQGEAQGLTQQGSAASLGRQKPLLMGEHSLISVQDPAHKALRALIMPAFTGEALEGQVPRMVAVIDKYLSRWAAAPGAVEAYEELRLLTFEFIIKLVLGRDVADDYVSRLSKLYRTWTAGLFAWPWINLPGTPFNKAVKAREELLTEFQAAVDTARARGAAGEEVEGVIGTLVTAVDEEGHSLSDDQIKDNLLLVLFAGHDTSSTTLTRMLSVLQKHPEALGELRREQQELVGRHGDTITPGVLREMVYADAVIKETLRVYPVVNALFRQAKTDIQLAGHKVEAGTPINVAFYTAAGADPRWADATGDLDPARFNPARMLTPEGQKQGWQMPFGFGPRFCVGYYLAMSEMKVFLALLARGYKYAADDATQWKVAVGRYPANGLPTVVARR